MRVLLMIAAMAAVCFSIPVHAQQQVRVTVENLQPTNGFFLTPVWVGFHDGGFDFFNAGALASTTLEDLAEEGIVGGLRTDFAAYGMGGMDGVLTGPAGFGSGAGQPPVIDTGEIASAVFDIDTSNRFLSYASMIIPSNDGFFGNDSGTVIEVFDAAGNFSFAGPFTFTLAQLWDGGTEVNNGVGAAFSAAGGVGTPEANTIALHAGLANFDGVGTAAGTTINFGTASNSPVFRLNVSAVPEPGSLAAIGLVGCLGILRRRR